MVALCNALNITIKSTYPCLPGALSSVGKFLTTDVYPDDVEATKVKKKTFCLLLVTGH